MPLYYFQSECNTECCIEFICSFFYDIVFVEMWYSVSVGFTISSFSFVCSDMILYEWVHETMCVCEIVQSYSYFDSIKFWALTCALATFISCM